MDLILPNEGIFSWLKGQTYRRYSLELKLEARLVNEEHMSIREVAKRLGIQNKSQVQVWAARTKRGMSLEPHIQTGTPQNEVFQYGRRDGILASGD